jgi:hypothetical protein
VSTLGNFRFVQTSLKSAGSFKKAQDLTLSSTKWPPLEGLCAARPRRVGPPHIRSTSGLSSVHMQQKRISAFTASPQCRLRRRPSRRASRVDRIRSRTPQLPAAASTDGNLLCVRVTLQKGRGRLECPTAGLENTSAAGARPARGDGCPTDCARTCPGTFASSVPTRRSRKHRGRHRSIPDHV